MAKKHPPEDIGTTAQIDSAVEFLDQNTASLPEALTARDLETLNAALRFFFADLRHAWKLFQESKEGQGRAGAIWALGAMWRLIALFQQPFADNLHVPILRLQDALRALNDNEVEPMLKPLPRRGRAQSTGSRAALRGCTAGAVARLMQAGVTKPEACAQVAKVLTVLGVRPERGRGQITATTVRHWCDAVAADVGRRSDAAIVYDSMFTVDEHNKFLGLSSDRDRRSFAIKSLEGFVRAVFPQGQKPT
jgi:hypothetical protein